MINYAQRIKEYRERKFLTPIPEYDQPDEQVLLRDGRLMWECTCYIRSWSMRTLHMQLQKN